jgi:hypothetical protein
LKSLLTSEERTNQLCLLNNFALRANETFLRSVGTVFYFIKKPGGCLWFLGLVEKFPLIKILLVGQLNTTYYGYLLQCYS